jgi:D-cysteine desulfhydrase
VKAPPRASLARLPTPLDPLDRLSERWGGPRIWIKRDDLTGTPLSGNKIRKLEFSLGEAMDRGMDRVLTCGGLQSNHCRATALACAKLGLRCVVFLRTEQKEPEPDGNHLLCRLAGAEVRFVTPEEYGQLGPTEEGYWIPEGASNEVGMWGYLEACTEIRDRSFDALFHAVGSGGTTAGLVMGATRYHLATPIVGVCVCDRDPDFFYGKVESILRAARVRWPRLPAYPPLKEAVEILDGFQGLGYALNRPEEWSLLREVAETEGIVLDPVYTIKAMMALRQAIRDGRYGRGQEVLFLHTGGIYGLFPKRDEALT